MIDEAEANLLLIPDQEITPAILDSIAFVGFENPQTAIRALRGTAQGRSQRFALAKILPGLLYALSESADSDRSVRNFQRYFESVDDREKVFESLIRQPRAVEILIRMFVGSQFLSGILLRNPSYLERLTQHQRLAEFKSREEFIEDARMAVSTPDSIAQLKAGLRTFHQWEILRIAACDTFGVMDLKTVTLQLSLLADALVQVSLENILRLENWDASDFAVIAFGKLGGLELNYSSDIDLVFVCERSHPHAAVIGQKLIQVLSEFTADGFLYRVDMRLRPWGDSGALVTSVGAYAEYFKKHAQLWERQAILKARTIAGAFQIGEALLECLKLTAFDVDPEEVRLSVWGMKDQIEAKVSSKTRKTGGVKSGPGGIRDIEFFVQYLQFIHGNQHPTIRRVGTREGLIALSDANLIHAQEYRILSTAYLILRTIEHSLQIMNNQPEYFLPESECELTYLARRLDFSDSAHFLAQYKEHTRAVRAIFDRHIRIPFGTADSKSPVRLAEAAPGERVDSVGRSSRGFTSNDLLQLKECLTEEKLVVVETRWKGAGVYEMISVGYDHLGNLPVLCGLLLVEGFDIISGVAETFECHAPTADRRIFVNRFQVRSTLSQVQGDLDQQWLLFSRELNELFQISITGKIAEVQKQLIRRLSETRQVHSETLELLLPVEISLDQDSDSDSTILHIRGRDVPGFLFELTNAITVHGFSIEKMQIQTQGGFADDTLYVVDPKNAQGLNEIQRHRLRATVALVRHFTHLLPGAANPEAALIHFRELLGNLFEQTDWLDQLQTLQQPEVLAALARLLGYSDFLWEDFLRLQHQNLFPVVTDIAGLQESQSRQELSHELCELLESERDRDPKQVLNEFKDRAMMRVDMRHILGLQTEFGTFSLELTAVAETIVETALRISAAELRPLYGIPMIEQGSESRLTVCALGKCGGRELGYASDIELMFLYDSEGQTNGPKRIPNVLYYQKLVERFQRAIFTRKKRIFEVDLRLRPYGNAGSLAVGMEAFEHYFKSNGPAWPFERQALVKLRPIAGDQNFGREIIERRDRVVYCGQLFDLPAMRAMREKQIRQLVQPGTFHAKLSPGGLVDCEYFVQGLQITFGHLSPAVREPNTRLAMKALQEIGILGREQRLKLRDAYRFLRRLIDGMRMVRGDATDLTIPHHNSEQFDFLAKRMGIRKQDLHQEIERQTCCVIEIISLMEELICQKPKEMSS